MFRLRLLAPAVARHLAAYATLGHAALTEWRRGFERQAVMLLASALLGLSALLVGCGWLLYSVRDRPERHFVALGLIVLLVLSALVSARNGLRAGRPGPEQRRLQHELQQDRGLLEEFSLKQR
jgi:uncharacterized membrane protein YqjE